jgi:hypothetical protein
MGIEVTHPYYYYDLDNNIFYNRVDAKKYGRKVKFYFHDKEFESFDWKIEPTESLAELYKQRAQQIRDKYDYVVLCYSGGVDSTNILETFYNNNIHIDEIFILTSFSQDEYKGDDTNNNAVFYNNTFPVLNDLHLPNTKITVYDYTKHLDKPEDLRIIQKYGSDYYKHIGVRTSLIHLFWYDMDKIINSKKRTVYIIGKEKPYLYREHLDGVLRFYTRFTDVWVMNRGSRYFMDNGDRVNFYTHPDAVKIVAKQLHTLKNIYFEYELRGEGELFWKNQIKITKQNMYNLKYYPKYENTKATRLDVGGNDKFMLTKNNFALHNIYKEAHNKLKNEIGENNHFLFHSKNYFIN